MQVCSGSLTWSREQFSNLFQKDIIAEIKISELVDTKDKDRKSISNECYEIIKNGIENNVN